MVGADRIGDLPEVKSEQEAKIQTLGSKNFAAFLFLSLFFLLEVRCP
jgi:hypothetical protein